MPRTNWRRTPPGQRWCAKCQDFRPIEMFGYLTSKQVYDNYCTYHRRQIRLESKRKYQRPKPQMVKCPHCGREFDAKA